jgi:predicted PurR-regulated permease PerM
VGRRTDRIGRKTGCWRGERFFDFGNAAVRSVLKGDVGMAVVQAVLPGSAYFMFDLPFAGGW